MRCRSLKAATNQRSGPRLATSTQRFKRGESEGQRGYKEEKGKEECLLARHGTRSDWKAVGKASVV